MLTKAGCTFDDVVDVTLFMMDADASLGFVLEEMKRVFPGEPKSNVTAVGVTWLSGFQFEIKVIARIPQ